MKMSLCQIIAIVCILSIGTIWFISPMSDAHASKVRHVKFYDVTICSCGRVLSKSLVRSAYYILETHAEDPLHSSGTCSINHPVNLSTKEYWSVTRVMCLGECPVAA